MTDAEIETKEGVAVMLQMLRDMREGQEKDLKEQRAYVQAVKTRSARDQQVIEERDKTIAELKAEIKELRNQVEKLTVESTEHRKNAEAFSAIATFNKQEGEKAAQQLRYEATGGFRYIRQQSLREQLGL